MANISPEERALFQQVEHLADRFEPSLCEEYARLFASVIERTIPGQSAEAIFQRYLRIRRHRRFHRDPAQVRNVFVLSRVTLGADVAVTSVMLAAAKELFENARIWFVGSQKGWELFDADPVLEHRPVAYGRSASLADRLAVWPKLREAVTAPDSIVIDPDSRLTQLGLLPVCDEEDYYFFESRAYGGDSEASLPELAQRWVAETFGVTGVKPFLSTLAAAGDPADVTVSLGVGENEAKRVADPFEEDLLRYLVQRESSILLDRGAGGEEARRADRAAAHSGGLVRLWDGSFAGFAAQIARSELYIGYDSAGGHVAAACGVPMVSIFGGYVSERMFQRWRPTGSGRVAVVKAADPAATLQQVTQAISTVHGIDQ